MFSFCEWTYGLDINGQGRNVSWTEGSMDLRQIAREMTARDIGVCGGLLVKSVTEELIDRVNSHALDRSTSSTINSSMPFMSKLRMMRSSKRRENADTAAKVVTRVRLESDETEGWPDEVLLASSAIIPLNPTLKAFQEPNGSFCALQNAAIERIGMRMGPKCILAQSAALNVLRSLGALTKGASSGTRRLESEWTSGRTWKKLPPCDPCDTSVQTQTKE